MQTVSLTSLGRQKAEELSGTGPRSQVLTVLYEEGSMNVGELASSTGLPEDKVAMVVRSLMKDGYIQKSGSIF